MKKYGLKITVDKVTRTEYCDGTICLKDNVHTLGVHGVAAGLLGVKTSDIKNVIETGNCSGCPFAKFINKEK